jgi:hypothetical protein
MEIRIKTNEAVIISNGWKPKFAYRDGAIYGKMVNNKLLEVDYDDEEKCINNWDISQIKGSMKDSESGYVHLEDMPAFLEELKKLEVK